MSSTSSFGAWKRDYHRSYIEALKNSELAKDVFFFPNALYFLYVYLCLAIVRGLVDALLLLGAPEELPPDQGEHDETDDEESEERAKDYGDDRTEV